MAYQLDDGSKLNYTCTGAVLNGALLVLGDTAGIALTAGATGDVIGVALKGQFSGIAKKDAASTDWAVGGRVYYMVTGTTNKLTGVAAAGQLIGIGGVAAVTGATTGTVILHGTATVLETQA